MHTSLKHLVAVFILIASMSFGQGRYAGVFYDTQTGQTVIFTNGIATTNIIEYLETGDTNWALGGGTLTGHVYTTDLHTNTAPSANELANVGWVRGLLAGGGLFYAQTNQNPVNTNFYLYTRDVPLVEAQRLYTSVTQGQYIGSVMTTQKFLTVNSPINVDVQVHFDNWIPARSAYLGADLYYTYDGTNLTDINTFANYEEVAGDLGTNLMQWVISFPTLESTNSTGFYLVRKLKVGAVSGTPNLSLHMTTNVSSSHISISSPQLNTVAGVSSITKDTTVNGAIVFDGDGVSQSGNTFTFAGGGVDTVAGRTGDVVITSNDLADFQTAVSTNPLVAGALQTVDAYSNWVDEVILQGFVVGVTAQTIANGLTNRNIFISPDNPVLPSDIADMNNSRASGTGNGTVIEPGSLFQLQGVTNVIIANTKLLGDGGAQDFFMGDAFSTNSIELVNVDIEAYTATQDPFSYVLGKIKLSDVIKDGNCTSTYDPNTHIWGIYTNTSGFNPVVMNIDDNSVARWDYGTFIVGKDFHVVGSGTVADQLASTSNSAIANTKFVMDTAKAEGWGSGGSSALTSNRTVTITNGTTSGAIQAQIDAQPKNLNSYTLTFQFADGTYTTTNTLVWLGFYGAGAINVYGNTGDTSDTNTSQSVYIDASGISNHALLFQRLSCSLQVKYFKVKVSDTQNKYCIHIDQCLAPAEVWFSYFLGAAKTQQNAGVTIEDSLVAYVRQNLVDNLYYGLESFSSRLRSHTNDDTGTQPTFGLWALNAGTIGKFSAVQPSGSSANEKVSSGGEIR